MEVTISSWSAVSSSVLMRTASSKTSSPSVAVKESLTEEYLPDFFLSKDLTPRTSELLILGLRYKDQLRSLGNLDDLSISEGQVEFIEAMRAQRELEAALPPVTDAFSLDIRTKKMEEAEFASWRRRESQMAEVKAKRLMLIKQVLEKYIEENVYARVEKKLTLVRGHKDADTTKYVLAADRVRNKIVRKLRATQLKTLHTVNSLGTVGKEKKLNKLRILDKLDCFKITGQRKFKPQFEVEVQDLKTVPGLNSIQLPKRKISFNVPQEFTTKADKEMLSAALRLIKTEINWRARAKAQAVINKAAEISAVGPATSGKEETPRFPRPRSAEDAETIRVLRGLMRQAEMEASLETRKLLIAELRAAEKETNLIYSEETLEAVEASIGEVVSQALDDLSKELVRLQEEQRLAVAVFAIVRERRMKEAEEAGRRQHEELRRDREDEIFRQIMDVNLGSVSSYIEGIIGHTIDDMVKEIPETVQVEEFVEASFADVVVDVVKNFLFPHIDRGELHRKLLEKRTAIRRAAVDALNVLVDRVIML